MLATASQTYPIHRVRDSPGKGKGQFAKKDILAGTRVICEAPLFSTEATGPLDIYGAYYDELGRLSANSKSKQRYFTDLHHNNLENASPPAAGTLVPQLEPEDRNALNKKAAYNSHLVRENQRRGNLYAIDTASAANGVAKFENNCFKIRNELNDGDAWAIFPKVESSRNLLLGLFTSPHDGGTHGNKSSFKLVQLRVFGNTVDCSCIAQRLSPMEYLLIIFQLLLGCSTEPLLRTELLRLLEHITGYALCLCSTTYLQGRRADY